MLHTFTNFAFRWKARRQGTPKILEETAKSGNTSVNGSVRTGFDPPKFETYIDAYNESSTDPVQQPVIQAEIKNNNYYMKGTATDYYKNESSTDDIDDNFLIHQTQTITLPREIQLIDRALEHEPGYLTVDSKHTTDTSGYQTTDSRHSQQRMSTFQGLDITIRDNKPKDPVHVSQPIVTSPAVGSFIKYKIIITLHYAFLAKIGKITKFKYHTFQVQYMHYYGC